VTLRQNFITWFLRIFYFYFYYHLHGLGTFDLCLFRINSEIWILYTFGGTPRTGDQPFARPLPTQDNNTTSVTMQPRKLFCMFSFLLSSQHVSALAGHHQVLLFMLKLSNCTAYHFYEELLSTKLRYGLIIFIKIVLFTIVALKFRL
jgi:hypothetical protein